MCAQLVPAAGSRASSERAMPAGISARASRIAVAASARPTALPAKRLKNHHGLHGQDQHREVVRGQEQECRHGIARQRDPSLCADGCIRPTQQQVRAQQRQQRDLRIHAHFLAEPEIEGVDGDQERNPGRRRARQTSGAGQAAGQRPGGRYQQRGGDDRRETQRELADARSAQHQAQEHEIGERVLVGGVDGPHAIGQGQGAGDQGGPGRFCALEAERLVEPESSAHPDPTPAAQTPTASSSSTSRRAPRRRDSAV